MPCGASKILLGNNNGVRQRSRAKSAARTHPPQSASQSIFLFLPLCFLLPDRRQAEEQQAAEETSGGTAGTTLDAVSPLCLLLVTTVPSGSERPIVPSSRARLASIQSFHRAC
jgi:hypothetical protein